MEDRSVTIIWTSPDADTAHQMVFTYARNALLNKWWDEVTVVIWGGSALLAATDPLIREKIKLLIEQGVHVSACISCATQLGVVDELSEQGIEVVRWGARLTELLQSKKHLLTI